jgi:excisionase family DNA binding protein
MTRPISWSPSAAAAIERIENKLFATTTEASAILRYDARTLRKAIEAGEIPAVRAGTTYRIPTSWLRERAGMGADGSEGAA